MGNAGSSKAKGEVERIWRTIASLVKRKSEFKKSAERSRASLLRNVVVRIVVGQASAINENIYELVSRETKGLGRSEIKKED